MVVPRVARPTPIAATITRSRTAFSASTGPLERLARTAQVVRRTATLVVDAIHIVRLLPLLSTESLAAVQPTQRAATTTRSRLATATRSGLIASRVPPARFALRIARARAVARTVVASLYRQPCSQSASLVSKNATPPSAVFSFATRTAAGTRT